MTGTGSFGLLANKLDFAQLNLRHRFDIDDAAIAAAQAGMGVVLAPEIFVRRECETGTLVAMPGTSAMRFGTYWVIPAPTGTTARRNHAGLASRSGRSGRSIAWGCATRMTGLDLMINQGLSDV